MTEARKRYIKVWRFENADKVRAQRRAWAKKNPEKVKANLANWMGKNWEKWREYHNDWRKRNQERVTGYGLKRLSARPDLSMFPTFASLDKYPGYENNLMIDRITPLDELIMKEEGLL